MKGGSFRGSDADRWRFLDAVFIALTFFASGEKAGPSCLGPTVKRSKRSI
jgi:hypothetical protein